MATDIQDFIYRLGYVQGGLGRKEVIDYFMERGVTNQQFDALEGALMPFAAATFKEPGECD